MTGDGPANGRGMRSWLFTPGNRTDRLPKAGESGADVVIVDLEDAVPADLKDIARDAALAWISGPSSCRKALRINPLDTRAGLSDLCALLDGSVQPEFVILPKASSVGQLQMLDQLLSRHGKAARLVPLIESVAGLNRCESLATATPRVCGLLFGAADMAADLGVRPLWNALSYARARIVAAAAGAGIMALDSPHFAIDDAAALADETRQALDVGFAGKAAIHPRQVAPINEVFSPTDAEIDEASAIIEAAKSGVAVIGNRMIDEAMARRARKVLSMAGKGGN